MIEMITPIHHVEFADSLLDMHRLRSRVFSGRLQWEVQVVDGLEIDLYDKRDPVYLLSRAGGQVQGCVRLLPSTGPTMLGDLFPRLLDGKPVPSDPLIWESSRFAVELASGRPRSETGLAQVTFELFAGMIEFGLSRGLSEIVTVTDVRVERILRRAQWPLCRLGSAHTVGSTLAIAGTLEVSHEALNQLRQVCGIHKRVLWAPVDFLKPEH